MSNSGNNPYRPYTQDHADWEIRRDWRRDESDRQFLNNWANDYKRTLSKTEKYGSEDKTLSSSDTQGQVIRGGGNSGMSIFASGEWLVQHILPLRIMESAGARLLNAGKTLRIVCMMVVAVVFVSLIVPDNGSVGWPWAHTLLTEITGDMAIFVAIAIGALMGWIMPTVAGVLLVLSAHLTGLAIMLLLIVGLIWLAYEFIIM